MYNNQNKFIFCKKFFWQMSGLKMSKGKKGRINSILDGRILIDNICFDKIPK